MPSPCWKAERGVFRFCCDIWQPWSSAAGSCLRASNSVIAVIWRLHPHSIDNPLTPSIQHHSLVRLDLQIELQFVNQDTIDFAAGKFRDLRELLWLSESPCRQVRPAFQPAPANASAQNSPGSRSGEKRERMTRQQRALQPTSAPNADQNGQGQGVIRSLEDIPAAGMNGSPSSPFSKWLQLGQPSEPHLLQLEAKSQGQGQFKFWDPNVGQAANYIVSGTKRCLQTNLFIGVAHHNSTKVVRPLCHP